MPYSPEDKRSPSKQEKHRHHAETLLDYLSNLQNCLFEHLENEGYHNFCPDVLCLSLIPLNNEKEPKELLYLISTEEKLAIQIGGSEGPIALVVDKENPQQIRVKAKEPNEEIAELRFRFHNFMRLRKLSTTLSITPRNRLLLHEARLPDEIHIKRYPINIEFTSFEENIYGHPLNEGPIIFAAKPSKKK
jgi:hypothetical protein